jgi:tetratricopeptide (TPR) repeat protein
VLQRDSAHARALAGVAMAYASASRWAMPIQGVPRDSLGPFAIRLSERALSIDSLDSDVWLARATVLSFLDPGRRAGVLAAYRRSLALDSTNAETWARYGAALHDLGRPDEGLEAFRTAFRLDSRRQNYWLSLHFLWTRELDSATKWADSAVSLTPDRYWSRNAAGYVALLAGDLAAAETHFTAAHLGETGNQRGGAAGLALVAALRGNRGYARKLLDEAIRVTDREHPDVHNPIYLASALDAFGDRAGALAWLERYQPITDLHYQMHLKFEPSLDPLRQEPRFQRLLRPLPP